MSPTFWKLMIFWWGLNSSIHFTVNTFNGWANPWPVVIYTCLFIIYVWAYERKKKAGALK